VSVSERWDGSQVSKSLLHLQVHHPVVFMYIKCSQHCALKMAKHGRNMSSLSPQ
jgi:hypothetical protein